VCQLELGWPKRIDAEYYRSDFLGLMQTQTAGSAPQKTLREICEKIDVGFVGSMTHAYAERGVPLLQTQNIKEFFVDLTNVIYIQESFHQQLKKTQVFPGDVLIARSGSIGNAAIVSPNDFQPMNSADIVILRPRDAFSGYYLCAYINSRFGQAQIRRLSSGGVQGHINLGALETVVVPELPHEFQSHIEAVIKTARNRSEESKVLYSQAAAVLAAELGLDKLDLSESLYSVRHVSEVAGAGRVDAEYFGEKYSRFMACVEEEAKRKGWVLERIGSLSAPLKYGSSTKLDYLGSGVPFLRITDVRQYRFDPDEIKYISPEAASLVYR
jgi:hypothetical protein